MSFFDNTIGSVINAAIQAVNHQTRRPHRPRSRSPVQAAHFPELARAQRRCQGLVAARGHAVPAEPAHPARLRAAQAGGSNADDALPRDLEGDIRDREAALKSELGRHWA